MPNKYLVFSDIHGCYKEFIILLAKVGVEELRSRTIILLGDYIDRGPESLEVVDLIFETLKRKYKIITLKGNHEDMLDGYINGDTYAKQLYTLNGGDKTLSLCKSEKEAEELNNKLKDLPLYYETDEYFFVHAGISPSLLENDIPMSRHGKDTFLWIRGEFINSAVSFPKTVVFGHTPLYEPLVKDDRIGIDCGCCFGEKLAMLYLPERKFLFQEKIKCGKTT